MAEDKDEYKALGEQLREEYQRLTKKNTSDSSGNGQQRLNPDRADLAQSYTMREKQTTLQAMEKNRLVLIENAIERLEDETYGQCIECRQIIRLERLKIIPTAELCISCQEIQERRK